MHMKNLLSVLYTLEYVRLTLIPTDDWPSLYGNIAKLCLGLISVFFDVLYAVQHFIFYK